MLRKTDTYQPASDNYYTFFHRYDVKLGGESD